MVQAAWLKTGHQHHEAYTGNRAMSLVPWLGDSFASWGRPAWLSQITRVFCTALGLLGDTLTLLHRPTWLSHVAWVLGSLLRSQCMSTFHIS